MITILHEQRETALPNAQAQGADLWLDAGEIRESTGWEWKPEGLCRDETCVPLPRGAGREWVRGERLNLSGLWEHMGQPVRSDAHGELWVLGAGAAQRREALDSLEAPDFALPDLDGKIHRLSDYRGRKVFLATWASW